MSSMNSQFEHSLSILSNLLGHSVCEKWSTGILVRALWKGNFWEVAPFYRRLRWSECGAASVKWWKLNRKSEENDAAAAVDAWAQRRKDAFQCQWSAIVENSISKKNRSEFHSKRIYQIRNRFSQTTEPVMPGPLTELNLSNYCPVFSPSSTRSK